MWRATFKGLLAHKVRLALTALSVVLGVAFVAGTFVLTDTINRTFDNLFAETQAGVDVTVRARSGFGEEGGVNDARDTLPASLLEAVARVPGVEAAEGGVGGFAQLVRPDGKAITTSGAPTLGFSWVHDEGLSPLNVRQGRAPEGDGEVVIDAVTARNHDLGVGQEVTVLTRAPAQPFRIVGIVGFGEADNLAGATLAVFDLPTAQRLFGKEGRFDTIDVSAAPGVTTLALRADISAVLPDGVEAVTGSQVAEESADAIKSALGFFNTALLTFAGISLFVGAFIIFNTFSILVAQRTRELALLRALGASRRQVLVSVVAEALAVGAVASAVGLGVGVLVAIGLQGLLKAFGIDIPTTETQFLARTVVVSLVVGTAVTVVSAIAPARRAARVAPMAALRDEAGADHGGSLRRRTAVGAVVLGAGAAALLGGLFGDAGISLVGLGAALTFLGVAMLSPLVTRPLAAAIGSPLPRLAGLPGKLGRENAMRNPRRTAATAAALMIGLGLVGCVSVLAASIKQSSTEIFDRSLTADFAVSSEFFMPTISPQVAAQLAGRPELAAVTGIKGGDMRVDGSRTQLAAADPAALRDVLNIEIVEGEYGSLARGALLVDEAEAESRDLSVGDTVDVQFARTGDRQFTVGAVYARNELAGRYLVSTEVFEANFTEPLDFVVLAKAASGVTPAQARQAIERVTAAFPNVEVRDQTQVKADQERQVNQLLSLITSLLGLAIVIALLGIVNTLALSVFERTRELGLLRAVGMARRQVRSMIRGESVIIAVLGAVLGLAVGTLFGWAIVEALDSEGVTSLVVPGGQLALYVVAAAVAGVLAAVFPARRAARLDVLAAISYE
jgi:putative ABC transport system permease protein